MKEKKSFMLAETVIKPCLHGGQAAIQQVKQLPLSRETITRRSIEVADNLKQQLIRKIQNSPCFGIQFDETTDVSNKAQLICYVRVPDTSSITDHYLFCLPVGVETTGECIFNKLNEFMEDNQIQWTKCRSVTTDGAPSMTGIQWGCCYQDKAVSDCMSTHCMPLGITGSKTGQL